MLERGEARANASFEALLRCKEFERPCRLIDISTRGARVSIKSAPAKGTEISLLLEPFGSILADTAWVRGESVGLRFNDNPEEIGTILMGLAIYAGVYLPLFIWQPNGSPLMEVCICAREGC